MIEQHLIQSVKKDGVAALTEVTSLLRMLELFSSILRSHQTGPSKFLRLLIKDRYVECLIEFYGRVKIEDRAVRQVFNEHVDEFKHCLHSTSTERE